MKSSSTSLPGLGGAQRLASRLMAASTALFVFFATVILNILFPMALLNPAWLLRLATSLIGHAYLPLIGLTLVHLGTYLHPKPSFEDLRRSLSQWAVIASLGFLMLLPLQGWASWHLIKQNFSSLEQGLTAPQDPLQAIEKAITEAPDITSLQTQLTILRGPTIAPQDAQRPLPELKQLLLRSLRQARANLQLKAKSSPDPRIWVLIQDVIRFSIGAIAYAIGFAAFAKRPGSPITLLEEWQSVVSTKG